jgi:hypothetical protein
MSVGGGAAPAPLTVVAALRRVAIELQLPSGLPR